MPCFNALPTEVLQKIIRNITKRPFRTELFLLNRVLCNLFMTEQNRSLRLSDSQLRRFITVITNNDMDELYSVPRYCNLLDRTYELDISICDNNNNDLFLEQVAGLFHSCINLRHLIIRLLTHPRHGSNITAIFGGLSLSIVEIKIISLWNNNKISQPAFEYIRRNKNLKKLELQIIRIGDDGAQALSEALKHNSTLQQLNLIGNKIGADGAKALAEYLRHDASLTHLNLSKNNISDDGARALGEALKHNFTLQQLDLMGNNIGNNGAQALSEALKDNSTLRQLNLDDNYIGADGARALEESQGLGLLISLKRQKS